MRSLLASCRARAVLPGLFAVALLPSLAGACGAEPTAETAPDAALEDAFVDSGPEEDAAVLDAAAFLLGHLRDGRADPDFKLLHAIVQYIEEFPERLHHPKEDQYLFARLKSRTHDADELIDSDSILDIHKLSLSDTFKTVLKRSTTSRPRQQRLGFVILIKALILLSGQYLRSKPAKWSPW